MNVGGFFWDGFDVVNVLLYHFEGRDTEAAVTLLRLIPVMGNFLALPVRLTLKLGSNAGEALVKLGKKYLPDLMENGSKFLNWAGGKIDDVWRWIQKKLGKAGTESGSGFSKYQKASLWERLTTRRADVNDLHANPLDEFSNPRIGPSDSAVAKYIKEINTTGRLSTPIEVQKLSTGGYEIVNGHHRWLAAQKAGLKRVTIKIKNYNN